ncbi:MAG: laccase domain-containing protein, partial [Acidobacteriota bacterium]
GPEVAERVAAVSGAAPAPLTVEGPRGRPHLDLPGTLAAQLRRAGVREPRVLARCTRCDEAHLWSYRREGPRGGRNVTYAWRTAPS